MAVNSGKNSAKTLGVYRHSGQDEPKTASFAHRNDVVAAYMSTGNAFAGRHRLNVGKTLVLERIGHKDGVVPFRTG